MRKKYQIRHHQIFQAQNAPKLAKSVFGDLGAYDAPLDPLLGWGGDIPCPRRYANGERCGISKGDTPFLIPLPRRLELGAYGASVLRPPSTQIPGYASE